MQEQVGRALAGAAAAVRGHQHAEPRERLLMKPAAAPANQQQLLSCFLGTPNGPQKQHQKLAAKSQHQSSARSKGRQQQSRKQQPQQQHQQKQQQQQRVARATLDEEQQMPTAAQQQLRMKQHQLHKQPIYQNQQQQPLFPHQCTRIYRSSTGAMALGGTAAAAPLLDTCCQQKQRSQSTCSTSSTSTAGTSITTGSSCSISLWSGDSLPPAPRYPAHQHQQPLPPPPPPPPPSRPWLARKQAKQRLAPNTPTSQLNHNKAYEFSALSYNVLADRMVYQDKFPNSPPLALDWLYRRQLILNQLLDYEPDIIALQELELEHYENYFKPELARLAAYESIFEPKSRAKTMDQHSRRRVDGCAIFYKFNKFKLIQRHLLEFNQIAMANAHGSEAMLNRVMTKDNIGLVAVLELTGRGDNPSSRTSNRLLVCNTHIHWDPEYCDVKLIQTIMLMNELECIAKYHSPSMVDEAADQRAFLVDSHTSSPFVNHNHLTTSNSFQPELSPTKPPHDLPPLVLLGDFNSMPNSGVTSYLTSGKIDSRHEDFKNFRYTSCTNALALHTQYYRNELSGARRQSTPAWCFYRQPNLSPSMSPTSSSSSSNSSTSSYMSALDSIPVLTDEPPVLNYNHPFHLQSAYEHNTMPYTNYTTDFKAIIDYIFFSSDSLQLLGLLGPLDKGWIKGNKITGLPHIHLPSDHLPLLIKLRFKPTPLRESSSHQLCAFTPSKNSNFRLSPSLKLDKHHYPNYHQQHTKQNNQTNKKKSNNNNITGPTIWHLCEPQNKHEQISRS